MFSKLPVHGDAFFRALIDAAPDGIVIVNQEGRIVLVNVQTEQLFGYTREELLEKTIEILVPERFRGKHRGHRAGFMNYQQLRPMGKALWVSAGRIARTTGGGARTGAILGGARQAPVEVRAAHASAANGNRAGPLWTAKRRVGISGGNQLEPAAYGRRHSGFFHDSRRDAAEARGGFVTTIGSVVPCNGGRNVWSL